MKLVRALLTLGGSSDQRHRTVMTLLSTVLSVVMDFQSHPPNTFPAPKQELQVLCHYKAVLGSDM